MIRPREGHVHEGPVEPLAPGSLLRYALIMDLDLYLGPIGVTLAYVLVYYGFQAYQLRVKTRLAREYRGRGEKFDRYFNQDRVMLAADRIVLNTVEHMGPFLALLWLYAFFIGPLGATVGGGIYVTARAAYPFVLGRRLGRAVPPRIFASTFVGYGVLAFFAVRLTWACLAAVFATTPPA